MQTTIPLFLAFATLCLSIPHHHNPAPPATLFANHVAAVRTRALTLPVSARQTGLNFSPCTANSTICRGDRTCLTFVESNTTFPPCTPGATCFCLPPNLLSAICRSDTECEQGESCVIPRVENPESFAVCVTNDLASFIGDPVSGDPVSGGPVSGGPVSTPPANPGGVPNPGVPSDQAPEPSGLTFDPCQNDAQCQTDRSCKGISKSGPGQCDGVSECRCMPRNFRPCGDDLTCEKGEGCLILGDVVDLPFLADSQKRFNVCISRAVVPRQESAPCIAAHSLEHISKEQLVFENDAVAYVLCDLNESCATPGHMVRYKGKGMMMKSYCQLTGCVRKVMRVNSPKYRRGLVVESKTDDLVFTALSARFESLVEEGVLSTAVRFGF